ncbi:hypothetical protein SAMN06265365_11092 [Tistlia consotensis]|uniref:Uncharacterized protein n=1 Tax=Tistlia consotensis USBA 355 TaxID=560819 RepID=A0A1Y6BYB4_9PROT|nr:hypothetical protein [Tistlia consotensis]SMF27184.1 hypothetical protein SAMN05428998_10964 [Tistlia consotensis USBA 355]SNR66395.1 hypothetical protein SAMN06265365_11092 [Tistlia consotensis]
MKGRRPKGPAPRRSKSASGPAGPTGEGLVEADGDWRVRPSPGALLFLDRVALRIREALPGPGRRYRLQPSRLQQGSARLEVLALDLVDDQASRYAVELVAAAAPQAEIGPASARLGVADMTDALLLCRILLLLLVETPAAASPAASIDDWGARLAGDWQPVGRGDRDPAGG